MVHASHSWAGNIGVVRNTYFTVALLLYLLVTVYSSTVRWN